MSCTDWNDDPARPLFARQLRIVVRVSPITQDFGLQDFVGWRQELVVLGTTAWAPPLELSQDVETFEHTAEHGVFAIEVVGWHESEEEL